jgi:hypothetical protein
MKTGFYKLEEKNVVPCASVDSGPITIAIDTLSHHDVSTIFLGAHVGDGPPKVFETMVFIRGQSREVDCARYATYDEAIAGHKQFVSKFSQNVAATRPDTNFLEYEAPRLVTDLDIPKSDDPRVRPFLKELEKLGVIDRDGNALKNMRLRRGVSGGNWIWRAEWES